VTALAEALRDSPEFDVPEFHHQHETTDKLGYPTSFRITVEWMGPAPARTSTATRSAS
jgi:hypothetical protein